MKLTAENYHSPEANWHYMSASQYKNFAGTMGQKGCEARAMAELRGEWKEEVTTALLVGSYVDAHFDGSLDYFKMEHPECFLKRNPKKKKGEEDDVIDPMKLYDDTGLKAEFRRAEEIIKRIERDPIFMLYLEGQKQTIYTAEMFGIPWKIKIDSLAMPGKFPNGRITDLKIMEALTKHFWVKDIGKMSFVQYWGYDTAAAIYQRVTQINTNILMPFFIGAASKETVTDIEIIGFDQRIDLDPRLMEIEDNIDRVIAVKSGKVAPDRCNQCDYCKSTKVLTKPIHFSELLEKV